MLNRPYKRSHHSVHVEFRGNHYLVDYNEQNEAIRIKIRKNKKPPMIGFYYDCRWSKDHHGLGTRANTKPKLIIAAAEEKKRQCQIHSPS